MAQPFTHMFTEDAEAQILLKCNGSKARWREDDVCSILVTATVVLCLSFLSMITLTLGLEKKLGVAGAREAMDSVGFKIFVLLDAMSFFCSMGTVAVLLQAMAIHIRIAEMNTVVSVCNRAAYVAMACACAAFVSAATTFPLGMQPLLNSPNFV